MIVYGGAQVGFIARDPVLFRDIMMNHHNYEKLYKSFMNEEILSLGMFRSNN